MNKPRLVFMGTPEFARVILERLVDSGAYDIAAVYSQPDKPAGRGNRLTPPPVAVFAKQKNLYLLQPPRIRDTGVLEELRSFATDFIVVAAYGKILPDEVMAAAGTECLNVHASLLPKYRGAAPINYALLNDERQTGVAIMKIVTALDAGPVYAERVLVILDDDDAVTLTEKLSYLGAEALIEVLKWINADGLCPKKQDEAHATYATKLSKDMALVNWKLPARKIFNQIRALVPWPVAETRLSGKRLQIHKSRVLAEKSRGTPGEILHIGREGWTVATQDQNLLVTEVQVEGKKLMPAFEAANGLRVKAGTVLF